MKLRSTMLVCSAVLLLLVSACTKKGDLSFFVTDAQTGNAISGAFVGLANSLDDISNESYFRTATTEADGRVIFTDIEKGDYAYTVKIDNVQYNFQSAVNLSYDGKNETITTSVSN